MPRTCSVPGCHESTAGYSYFCRKHKQTQRRHGSPTQLAVTAHELRPYAALVDARRAKNPESEAWTILEARWEAVLRQAQDTLQHHAEGRVGVRWERLAAHQLVTIGRDVESWAVVRTALAMYLMLDQQPSRFACDAAFDHQLVRRVRGLTDSNAGAYWDHQEQRSKRVYRDIPPRVIQAMAQPLKTAFGATGLTLAAKEREDIDKANEERQRLAAALEGLA